MASKASQRTGSNTRRRKITRATNCANQGWSKLGTADNQLRQHFWNEDTLGHRQLDAARRAKRQGKQDGLSFAFDIKDREQVGKDAGSTSSASISTSSAHFSTSSSSGIAPSTESGDQDDLLPFEDPLFGREPVDSAEYWNHIYVDGPEPLTPFLTTLQSW